MRNQQIVPGYQYSFAFTKFSYAETKYTVSVSEVVPTRFWWLVTINSYLSTNIPLILGNFPILSPKGSFYSWIYTYKGLVPLYERFLLLYKFLWASLYVLSAWYQKFQYITFTLVALIVSASCKYLPRFRRFSCQILSIVQKNIVIALNSLPFSQSFLPFLSSVCSLYLP